MVIYNSDDPAVSNSGEQLFNPGLSPASVPALLVRRSDGLALKSFIDGELRPPEVGHDAGPRPPGTPPFVGPGHAGPSDVVLFPRPYARRSGSSRTSRPSAPTAMRRARTTRRPGRTVSPRPIRARGASTIFDASGFEFAAGTSFSAPRTAGAAALVKQKHPGWTPELVKAALTETASRPADSSRIGSERVMARGAGDIDLAAAATVESVVLPTSTSFGRRDDRVRALHADEDVHVEEPLERRRDVLGRSARGRRETLSWLRTSNPRA